MFVGAVEPLPHLLDEGGAGVLVDTHLAEEGSEGELDVLVIFEFECELESIPAGEGGAEIVGGGVPVHLGADHDFGDVEGDFGFGVVEFGVVGGVAFGGGEGARGDEVVERVAGGDTAGDLFGGHAEFAGAALLSEGHLSGPLGRTATSTWGTGTEFLFGCFGGGFGGGGVLKLVQIEFVAHRESMEEACRK